MFSAKASASFKVVRKTPVLIGAAAIVLAWLLALAPRLWPSLTFLDRLEAISYDARVRMAVRHEAPCSSDLGLVSIDNDDLKSVNDFYNYQWPWPRQMYGRLLSELAAQGAKVVGFDILFRELEPDSVKKAVEVAELLQQVRNLKQLDRREGDAAQVAERALEAAYEKILQQSLETALVINGKVIGSDDYFAEELARTGIGVLAAAGQDVEWVSSPDGAATSRTKAWEAVLPNDRFRTNAWMVGHVLNDADDDGVLRRARVFHDDPRYGRIWHMGVLLAARQLGLDVSKAQVLPGQVVLSSPAGERRVIPVDRNGYFYINWSLRWNDARLQRVPFYDVLLQEIRRSNGATDISPFWRDKIVIVGSLGSGGNISDIGATPLSRQDFLVSQHWNVANSILTNIFVRRSDSRTEAVLLVLLGSLAGVLTWRLRPLWASFLLCGLLAAYFVLAFWLFVESRYWLPLALPTATVLLCHVSLVTYRVLVEQKERNRVRSVFAKVVAPNIVNELLKADTISLGGTRRNITVYFADIRGFTQVTDESQVRAEEYVRTRGLSPVEAEEYLDGQAREVLATVNQYLGVVEETVKRHNGTFDKYIGDCVMAFWGAPTPNERHALDCVRAAIDAQRAIYALNLQRAEENRRREQENANRRGSDLPPLPLLTLLALGSGINTGVVTVGLMGSHTGMSNYTAFGREVNLASRLEGISGRSRIVISESTYRELQRLDPSLAAICETLPPVTVKGFRDQLQVYEVLWRRLDESTLSYDTGILGGGADSAPTDLRTAGA